MGSTLTIRNLDDAVKQRLRVRAAQHQRSMEAEAREILAAAVNEHGATPRIDAPRTAEEMRERLRAITGLWKGRGTTDELMRMTRGED